MTQLDLEELPSETSEEVTSDVETISETTEETEEEIMGETTEDISVETSEELTTETVQIVYASSPVVEHGIQAICCILGVFLIMIVLYFVYRIIDFLF